MLLRAHTWGCHCLEQEPWALKFERRGAPTMESMDSNLGTTVYLNVYDLTEHVRSCCCQFEESSLDTGAQVGRVLPGAGGSLLQAAPPGTLLAERLDVLVRRGSFPLRRGGVWSGVCLWRPRV